MTLEDKIKVRDWLAGQVKKLKTLPDAELIRQNIRRLEAAIDELTEEIGRPEAGRR